MAAAAGPPASAASFAVSPVGLARQLVASSAGREAARGSLPTTEDAGYVASGSDGKFTSVATDWTQPKVTCGSTEEATAFWAGLDGYTSDTVEQVGTLAECYEGTAYYYAWYEMYPQNSIIIFGGTVKAGDHLAVSVSYLGSDEFALKVSDTTQGWTQTKDASADADRSSAEILVEAPSSSTVPLAGFGSITFTDALVNGAGLCDSDPTAVTSPGLSVSSIVDCTSFTVTQTGTAGPPRGPGRSVAAR